MSSAYDRLWDGLVRTRGRNVVEVVAQVTISGASGAVGSTTGDTNVLTVTKETGAGTYTFTLPGPVSAFRKVRVTPILASAKTVTSYIAAVSTSGGYATTTFVNKSDTAVNLADGEGFLVEVEFSAQFGSA